METKKKYQTNSWHFSSAVYPKNTRNKINIRFWYSFRAASFKLKGCKHIHNKWYKMFRMLPVFPLKTGWSQINAEQILVSLLLFWLWDASHLCLCHLLFVLPKQTIKSIYRPCQDTHYHYFSASTSTYWLWKHWRNRIRMRMRMPMANANTKPNALKSVCVTCRIWFSGFLFQMIYLNSKSNRFLYWSRKERKKRMVLH